MFWSGGLTLNGLRSRGSAASSHRAGGINDDQKQTFFAQAPQMNPNISKITGVICGYPVEDIEDKLMQKIRYMDKLIDELARGKKMEKILRP